MTYQSEVIAHDVYENRGKILAAIAVALLAWGLRLGQKVAARDAIIAARPTVSERVRVERGPVRIVRTTVYLPDGTKKIEQSRDIASEKRETDHTEAPACPAPHVNKPRWAHGIGDMGGPYALNAGMTFWDRLDVGASYDWRHKAPGFVIGGRW
jgi:hypothetical protein